MFKYYVALAEAIQKATKKISWFDLDKGQLDNPNAFNSIVPPGILIGNSKILFQQLVNRNQLGDGTMTIKLVLRLPSETHLLNPLLQANLEPLELADEVNQSVLAVPGVLSRVGYEEYPQGTFYVVEQTYTVQYKTGPSYRQQQVALQINPTLFNLNQATA